MAGLAVLIVLAGITLLPLMWPAGENPLLDSVYRSNSLPPGM
jgi:hypothetical protein